MSKVAPESIVVGVDRDGNELHVGDYVVSMFQFGVMKGKVGTVVPTSACSYGDNCTMEGYVHVDWRDGTKITGSARTAIKAVFPPPDDDGPVIVGRTLREQLVESERVRLGFETIIVAMIRSQDQLAARWSERAGVALEKGRDFERGFWQGSSGQANAVATALRKQCAKAGLTLPKDGTDD